VIGGNRTVGLAGATIGLGEGVEGSATNTAAPSVREPFSATHVDYDGTASLYLPGFFAGTDFENRGAGKRASAYDDFLITGAGGQLQIGSWGVAAAVDLQSFRVRTNTADRPDLDMNIVRYNAMLSHAFFGDQLSVGLGVRAVTMFLGEPGTPVGSLLTMAGISPQVGLLARPDEGRFRLGATFRAPVYGAGLAGGRSSYDGHGVQIADGFVLPQQIVLPAEVEAGVAVQVGPRDLNVPWQNPYDQEAPLRERMLRARQERETARDAELAKLQEGEARELRRKQLEREEQAIVAVEDARMDAESERLLRARRARYENLPRARIMFVASVLALASSAHSIAVSSFLSQRDEPYGASWTLTPRFGVEAEPVIDRLVLRLGGYLEPARFLDAVPRQHLTFGGDVKLFAWDVFGLVRKLTWKLGLGIDVAPRYTNWGVGLGVWH
jgi:hypothetical protein